MSNKVSTIIGFAVKANKLIYGMDELDSGKRKRYLIIFCGSLSERARKDLNAIAIRDHVPLIEVKTRKLEDIVNKKNCKVIGVANKQMSEAIIKYITDDYSLIKSEGI